MRAHSTSPSRRGTALVAASLVVVVLASAATVMLTQSVSRMQEQTLRGDQVLLNVTAESVFNAGLDHFRTILAQASATAANNTMLSWTATDLGLEGLNAQQNGNVLWMNFSRQSDVVPTFSVFVMDHGATATIGDEANESYRLAAKAWVSDRNVATGSFEQLTHGRTVEALAVSTTRAVTLPKVAMFAMQGFEFGGSANTDSFWSGMALSNNSSPYDQWAKDAAIAVDLTKSPPVVSAEYTGTGSYDKGDLQSYYEVIVDKPGNVKGSTADFSDMSIELPSCEPPAGATWIPGSGSGITATTTLYGQTYRTAFVRLSGSNQSTPALRIAANCHAKLYVEGPFVLEDAQVVFENDQARLEIYQKDFSGDAGTGVGAFGTKLNGNKEIGQRDKTGSFADTDTTLWPCKPTQLIIFSAYGTDAETDGGVEKQHDMDLKLNGNAGFSGLIYAPGAPFRMNGNFSFYGAVLARSFNEQNGGKSKVNGNYKFYYDQSIATLDLGLAPRVALEVQGLRTYTGDTDLTGTWTTVPP